ncbi:MAG TPA: hypothetical protein VGX25_04150, partial [Actinophytocola sp.]|uniref:hypothetical protein n=1 Tax=Actinophytocola sp. TaxID=1872138 RepID=UPI002DDCFFDC
EPVPATAPEPAADYGEQPARPPADRAPAELVKKIKGQLASVGVTSAAEMLFVLRKLTGRPLGTSADITTQEGARIADILTRARAADDPARAFDQVLAEIEEGNQPGPEGAPDG